MKWVNMVSSLFRRFNRNEYIDKAHEKWNHIEIEHTEHADHFQANLYHIFEKLTEFDKIWLKMWYLIYSDCEIWIYETVYL